MGVIKRKPEVGVFTSGSEESLRIGPSSEDEASSVSELESPVLQSSGGARRHLIPEPMCVAGLKKHSGKKRFRRYENIHHLETLVEDQELSAVTIYDFIPNSCEGFTRVLDEVGACEAWEQFVESSEEEQLKIIQRERKLSTVGVTSFPRSPEESFKSIKTGLRNTLKKSRVPLGMIEHFESKVTSFFSDTPTNIFISEQLSSFERLLLHAVSQYYCLRSLSFDSESENVRLVRISNPFNSFHQPMKTLVEFLVEQKKASCSQLC